jgi:hypothetical protein
MPTKLGSPEQWLGVLAIRAREARLMRSRAGERFILKALHVLQPGQTRDPALVGRVRSLRGRLALPQGAILASEELHRERQREKAKEEEQLSRECQA